MKKYAHVRCLGRPEPPDLLSYPVPPVTTLESQWLHGGTRGTLGSCSENFQLLREHLSTGTKRTASEQFLRQNSGRKSIMGDETTCKLAGFLRAETIS